MLTASRIQCCLCLLEGTFVKFCVGDNIAIWQDVGEVHEIIEAKNPHSNSLAIESIYLIVGRGAGSGSFSSSIVAKHHFSSVHKSLDLELRPRADQKLGVAALEEILKLTCPIGTLEGLKGISKDELEV